MRQARRQYRYVRRAQPSLASFRAWARGHAPAWSVVGDYPVRKLERIVRGPVQRSGEIRP